jgi:hypothetical protein
MRRREFITGLGAALSVASPVAARAQQRERVRPKSSRAIRCSAFRAADEPVQNWPKSS